MSHGSNKLQRKRFIRIIQDGQSSAHIIGCCWKKSMMNIPKDVEKHLINFIEVTVKKKWKGLGKKK